MPTIQLIDYAASARCRSLTLTSREGFPAMTCRFEGGRIYGLCSDIGGGAWALTHALGGRAENPEGEILADGVHASPKALAARACFIGEQFYPSVNSRLFPGTVRSSLEKALNIGKTGWTLAQLTARFHIARERLDRSPAHIYYNQILYISAAVGFAAGRSVFCFPYLTADTIKAAEIMRSLGVLDLLKEHGKIVLLPSFHRDRLSALCDQVVDIASPASTSR